MSKQVSIPTIGIGAGNGCDGQVLVYSDMLGMDRDFSPKFVKKYANLSEVIEDSVKNYIKEVQSGVFPAKENTYKIEDEVIDSLKNMSN